MTKFHGPDGRYCSYESYIERGGSVEFSGPDEKKPDTVIDFEDYIENDSGDLEQFDFGEEDMYP